MDTSATLPLLREGPHAVRRDGSAHRVAGWRRRSTSCPRSSTGCSRVARSSVSYTSPATVWVTDPSTGPNFLPLLVGRFARERLWALGAGRGARGRRRCPRCCSSASTTRVAPRWPQASSTGWDGRIRASAGSRAGATVSPEVVDAMREVGLDVADEFPKLLTERCQRRRLGHHDGLRRRLPLRPDHRTRTGTSPTPPGDRSRTSAPSAMPSTRGSGPRRDSSSTPSAPTLRRIGAPDGPCESCR